MSGPAGPRGHVGGDQPLVPATIAALDYPSRAARRVYRLQMSVDAPPEQVNAAMRRLFSQSSHTHSSLPTGLQFQAMRVGSVVPIQPLWSPELTVPRGQGSSQSMSLDDSTGKTGLNTDTSKSSRGSSWNSQDQEVSKQDTGAQLAAVGPEGLPQATPVPTELGVAVLNAAVASASSGNDSSSVGESRTRTAASAPRAQGSTVTSSSVRTSPQASPIEGAALSTSNAPKHGTGAQQSSSSASSSRAAVAAAGSRSTGTSGSSSRGADSTAADKALGKSRSVDVVMRRTFHSAMPQPFQSTYVVQCADKVALQRCPYTTRRVTLTVLQLAGKTAQPYATHDAIFGGGGPAAQGNAPGAGAASSGGKSVAGSSDPSKAGSDDSNRVAGPMASSSSSGPSSGDGSGGGGRDGRGGKGMDKGSGSSRSDSTDASNRASHHRPHAQISMGPSLQHRLPRISVGVACSINVHPSMVPPAPGGMTTACSALWAGWVIVPTSTGGSKVVMLYREQPLDGPRVVPQTAVQSALDATILEQGMMVPAQASSSASGGAGRSAARSSTSAGGSEDNSSSGRDGAASGSGSGSGSGRTRKLGSDAWTPRASTSRSSGAGTGAAAVSVVLAK